MRLCKLGVHFNLIKEAITIHKPARGQFLTSQIPKVLKSANHRIGNQKVNYNIQEENTSFKITNGLAHNLNL